MNQKRNPLHLSAYIDIGTCTDIGTSREENQDAYSIPPDGAPQSRRGTFLCVADGVGGVPEGKLASEEAVALIQALYYADTGPDAIGDRLQWCIRLVNNLNMLNKREYEDERRLTTIVAAVIIHDEIYVASAGDSRAYLIHPQGKTRPLTQDDSEELRKNAGELVEEVYDYHKRSGYIDAGIGMELDLIPSVYRETWQPGDWLLLATDGIGKLRPQVRDRIVKSSSPQKAAQKLIQMANHEDGRDNSTVVIAHWSHTPVNEPQHAQSSPAFSWGYRLSYLFVGILVGLFLLLILLNVFPDLLAGFLPTQSPTPTPEVTPVGMMNWLNYAQLLSVTRESYRSDENSCPAPPEYSSLVSKSGTVNWRPAG